MICTVRSGGPGDDGNYMEPSCSMASLWLLLIVLLIVRMQILSDSHILWRQRLGKCSCKGFCRNQPRPLFFGECAAVPVCVVLDWIQSTSLTAGALDGHGSNQAHLLNVSFSLQHLYNSFRDRALEGSAM